MSLSSVLLDRLTDAVSDVSLTGWAVFFVFIALFYAKSMHKPVSYRHLSGSERRMIQKHRARQNSSVSFLDNNGKKISKEQFYTNVKKDQRSWNQYSRSQKQTSKRKSFSKPKSKPKSTNGFSRPVRNLSARSSTVKNNSHKPIIRKATPEELKRYGLSNSGPTGQQYSANQGDPFSKSPRSARSQSVNSRVNNYVDRRDGRF